jgi:hypothetical protein
LLRANRTYEAERVLETMLQTSDVSAQLGQRKRRLLIQVWAIAIAALVLLGTGLVTGFHSTSMLAPVALVCVGAGVVGTLLVYLDFIEKSKLMKQGASVDFSGDLFR